MNLGADLGQLAVFAGTSGLVAGLTNQGLGAWRESRAREHETKARASERAAERADADTARREAAHAAARDEFADIAADVEDWISYLWAELYGMGVGYVGGNVKPPRLAQPAEVISALYLAARRHPTRAVRELAESLAGQIEGRYNVDAGGLNQPTEDDIRSWWADSVELREAILEPLPAPGG